MRTLLITSALLILLQGCTPLAPRPWIEPTPAQLQLATSVGIEPQDFSTLLNKPLYEMQPAEVGRYLPYLQKAEPNLRKRVADLARKNLNQPYELYLLGEFPYEIIDPQPLFDLTKSDCVVFVEHTYAMALSNSWEEFFWMLQRIRYKDGVIGVTTRNHYTETDWNPNNAWLLTDITRELAGPQLQTYPLKVDRQRFFKNRYHLQTSVPVESVVDTYIPKEAVAGIVAQLQEGDFVNVISGKGTGRWASHVGIVVIGPNGERHMIHSQEPLVREETFESFMQRAAEREARNTANGVDGTKLFGFKFLRLNEKPEVPPMKAQPRPGSAS